MATSDDAEWRGVEQAVVLIAGDITAAQAQMQVLQETIDRADSAIGKLDASLKARLRPPATGDDDIDPAVGPQSPTSD